MPTDSAAQRATDDVTERIDNSVLRHEITLAHHGIGDRETMVSALRASVLYVPRSGDTAVMAADQQGVRWLYAFTTAGELADFNLARSGPGAALTPVRYATVRGDRLMDDAVPGMGRDSGLAVDVAGVAPMFFLDDHAERGERA